jgi:aryl-alcohol dehydrogenase-like predicted oxidoreductase
MRLTTLGRSDLAITPIGLGTWAIGGGDWICGWGPQKDDASIATIRRAVERGINWIDTAGVYGLGHAERVVARALRPMPFQDRPLVFASCGLTWDRLGNVSHDLRPESIRREVDGSLARLGIEVIALLQLGWPTWPYSPPGHDPGSLEEAWKEMARLQRDGKVRHLGVSNCDQDQLAIIEAIAPVTCVQASYSLLARGIESTTLPFFARRQVPAIACSPLQCGLLTGRMTPERVGLLPHNDWRRRSSCFQEPAIRQAMRHVERLRSIGRRMGVPPAAVAVAWTLQHPAIAAALVGARRPEQVDELVAAASVQFSTGDLEELETPAGGAGDNLSES